MCLMNTIITVTISIRVVEKSHTVTYNLQIELDRDGAGCLPTLQAMNSAGQAAEVIA